jgi:hypothetical protein
VNAAAGAATAQTVIVTKAPPGAAVEIGLNAAMIGSTTADAGGIATLPVNLEAHGRRPEVDVRIFVDVCEKTRRVMLVESGWQAPSPVAGCTRHEIFGVFYLKKITTVVVKAAEQTQAVWIKQGPAPATWLSDAPTGGSSDAGPAGETPTGLVLFGGVGFSRYDTAGEISCGNVSECSRHEFQFAGRFGGEYWVFPYLGVSVSYLKPMSATTQGSGAGYQFDSALSPNVVTISGKIGIPYGRFRAYAGGGTNYTWATLTTNETLDDRNLTVGDATQVVPGGTQTFELKMDGWGWTVGGGVEIWATRSAALFGEFEWTRIKGHVSGGGEGTLDDRLQSVIFGVRVRVGGGKR